MKTKYLIIAIVLIALIPMGLIADTGGILEADKKSIGAAFGKGSVIDEKLILVNRDLRKKVASRIGKKMHLPRIFVYHEIQAADTVRGYYLSSVTEGRYDPVEFSVLINSQMKIHAVNLYPAKSQYGQEVKKRSFRNQFTGKGSDDPFKIYVDIDSVSGATISSESIARAIKKNLVLLEEAIGSN